MDVLQINQWLIDKYGKTVDGHAHWRVVWSTNLTEKRNGTFNERTSGGIFLREVKGVQEVLKYPFDQDRWVLEQLVEINQNSQVAKELVENQWSYEPFYVFKDKSGKMLPLNRDVIDVMLYLFYNRRKRTPSELEAPHIAAELAEREYYIQKIGEMQQVPHLMDLVE